MNTTSRYFFPVVIALFLAIHWANQLLGTYGLMFDEAQYWFWAKHPALGYYSKPPVIAWLISSSTSLFGDGNFGVKMLSPVLLLGIGALLYRTALRLQQPEGTARWVFLTYLTLPLATGNGAFFTTDVPLQFFWALALYAVITALTSPAHPRYWLLAGVAVGFGFLSKYTMIAFGASTLLALVLIPENRKQFISAWPWAAAVLALAIFSPNLWWNAQHQFVTFKHTDDNVISKTVELYPADMLEFTGAQFAVMGPILLIALLLSLRHARRDALLHCFVWPLAIAGIVVSLIAGAQAHWIAPAYLAGLLIVVPTLATHRPLLLRVSLALHVIILLLFYTAPTMFDALHVKRNPLERLFVWDALGEEIKPLIVQYPHAVLLTTERKIAAALTYNLRDVRCTDEPLYKWRRPGDKVHDHYDMLTDQQNFSGREALVLARYDAGWKPTQDAQLLRDITLGHFHFVVYRVAKIASY